MCEACGSRRAPWHLLKIKGYGEVRACIKPRQCRERAQAAGVWLSTALGGVHAVGPTD